jgi:hypothetical protein
MAMTGHFLQAKFLELFRYRHHEANQALARPQKRQQSSPRHQKSISPNGEADPLEDVLAGARAAVYFAAAVAVLVLVFWAFS